MSTRKQLSLLLAVLIGGTGLVAIVATTTVSRIRGEIVRMSHETSPTQVKLAKLHSGFERISSVFARIAAVASPAELIAIESEFDQTIDGIQSIAGQLGQTAGGANGAGEGDAIRTMKQTGDALRHIAHERIDTRKSLAEATVRVTGEIATVTLATKKLSAAMARLQKSSQNTLESSRQTSLEANVSIHSLLVARGDVQRLLSLVHEVRAVDKKFHLSVLNDKADGILGGMAPLDLTDKTLAAQLKQFAGSFASVWSGDQGLVAARVAVLAAPLDQKVTAAYEARQKAITELADKLVGSIAEEIDPLELTVMKANRGMNEATALIGRVSQVTSAVEDVDTRAQSIDALAWRLLSAGDLASADAIGSEISQQSTLVASRLDQVREHLAALGHAGDAGEVAAAAHAFVTARELLIGPNSVASAVRLNLQKHQDAERLFAGARDSIRQVAVAGSERARRAEIAQDQSVARIGSLSAATFIMVGIVALLALLTGTTVGSRVRQAILATEERLTQLKDKLRQQASHDVLTGLANRLLFGELLSHAIENASAAGTELAVLYVDLDRFKQVNDTLGHRIGDLFLIEVSKRMQHAVGEEGVVARIGGDEFSILLKAASAEQARRAAERILTSLSEPLVVDNCPLQAGCSIGIAQFPQDGTDADALQKNADQAMYRAKNSGRNQLAVFDWRLSQSNQESNQIQKFLGTALKNGEFCIQYQPQFHAAGDLRCFEALLRFRHPQFGVIPPSRFIPVAEESGLIVPIGDWVLREVASQILKWDRMGLGPVRVAVNVSTLQFARADFLNSLKLILRETGVAPELLELEVTESVVMSNLEEAQRQMLTIRALGLNISIDDFGTGYSSLSYLHKLQVDWIKIDQSFIRDINNPVSTLPLIQAIISAAHAFGLGVVAEGVETESQRSALAAIGCDCMQGYLFARPLPAEMAEALLRERCDLKAGVIEAAYDEQLAGLLSA